jgi:hypothetical protein
MDALAGKLRLGGYTHQSGAVLNLFISKPKLSKAKVINLFRQADKWTQSQSVVRRFLLRDISANRRSEW